MLSKSLSCFTGGAFVWALPVKIGFSKPSFCSTQRGIWAYNHFVEEACNNCSDRGTNKINLKKTNMMIEKDTWHSHSKMRKICEAA